MKLSDLKTRLLSLETLRFKTPEGEDIPPHFHITEAGLSTKHFVDCGGTIRKESAVCLQIWTAEDKDHRLSAEKLLGILNKAEPLFSDHNLEVEIEYQTDTIGRYSLSFNKDYFQLVTKQTDCLAKELCGVPEKPSKGVTLNEEMVQIQSASDCTPGGGCC